MRLVAILTAVVAAAASFLTVLLIRTAGSPAAQAAPGASPHLTPVSLQVKTPPATKATAKRIKLGIISYDLPLFEKDTKIFPSITAKYFNWGTPFPRADVLANHSVGSATLIVLEPRTQNMQKLAGGKYDSYLKKWAAAERKLGLPIVLSFAPEANGDWYPWGKGHISPAMYRKIFQHVHNVLLKDGATQVTWLWQVDRSSSRTAAIKPLFPGKAYVNEIGLDGQLSADSPTFNDVFGSAVKSIRAFTKLPLLFGEVGVEAGSTAPKKINALFAAARKYSMTTVMFFDVGRWNFDKNPAALKAIRADAAPKN